MTNSRRIQLAPIWVALALALAIVLLAVAVVPAFAIVHPCAPIANGVANSPDNAGGKAALGKGIDGGGMDGSSDVDAPLPAQGTANSGSNSPGSPGGECPE